MELAHVSVLKANKDSNPKGLKLVIDVSTRWNSTYDMMVRYNEIHAAVYAALTEMKVSVLIVLFVARKFCDYELMSLKYVSYLPRSTAW